MQSPLIELNNLQKHYPSARGVGPIHLDLDPGIHGLLGPNGSGKTTLIKTLLGFLAPTSGGAKVLGYDIVAQRMNVRRNVGYMAENDVFVPGLNAVQTVRLGAELCGLPSGRAFEAASEALHAVGMSDERFHAPNRLSTGQRQKMKLATSLVHAPKLLFLDEPTNGLDPRSRRRMLDLIEEISREKDISVVLSTHILPDVESVCDTAIVLKDGQFKAHEQVNARTTSTDAAGNMWYHVELLGDNSSFISVCEKQKVVTASGHGGLRVAVKDFSQLLRLAMASGDIMTKVVPSTRGVEDAVLDHMEAL